MTNRIVLNETSYFGRGSREKVAEEIKNITSESNEEISKLAYEHELAAKASYLEFLNDNFDKLKDLIENMEDK